MSDVFCCLVNYLNEKTSLKLNCIAVSKADYLKVIGFCALEGNNY